MKRSERSRVRVQVCRCAGVATPRQPSRKVSRRGLRARWCRVRDVKVLPPQTSTDQIARATAASRSRTRTHTHAVLCECSPLSRRQRGQQLQHPSIHLSLHHLSITMLSTTMHHSLLRFAPAPPRFSRQKRLRPPPLGICCLSFRSLARSLALGRACMLGSAAAALSVLSVSYCPYASCACPCPCARSCAWCPCSWAWSGVCWSHPKWSAHKLFVRSDAGFLQLSIAHRLPNSKHKTAYAHARTHARSKQ